MISVHFWRCCRKRQDGLTLRHVVEVRHESFRVPEFAGLLAKHKDRRCLC